MKLWSVTVYWNGGETGSASFYVVAANSEQAACNKAERLAREDGITNPRANRPSVKRNYEGAY